MSRLTDILSRCLRCLYETVCVERMCQQVQLLPAVLDFTVLFFRAMPVTAIKTNSPHVDINVSITNFSLHLFQPHLLAELTA